MRASAPSRRSMELARGAHLAAAPGSPASLPSCSTTSCRTVSRGAVCGHASCHMQGAVTPCCMRPSGRWRCAHMLHLIPMAVSSGSSESYVAAMRACWVLQGACMIVWCQPSTSPPPLTPHMQQVCSSTSFTSAEQAGWSRATVCAIGLQKCPARPPCSQLAVHLAPLLCLCLNHNLCRRRILLCHLRSCCVAPLHTCPKQGCSIMGA